MAGIFANRWWIVFASACGLLVGTGSILIFSFGVFLKPVTEDLGISRGEFSTALGSTSWLTALGCPLVGWLIDRWGARRTMIPGILLFALSVAGFGLMQAKPVYVVFLIFGIVAFVGAVQSPIPYAAVVSRWFDRQRGFALGLATAGVGLGVALIPQLAALLINRFGWRDAYFGLAIAIVVLASACRHIRARAAAGCADPARASRDPDNRRAWS